MISLLKRLWVFYWYAVFTVHFFLVYPFLFLFSQKEWGQRFIMFFRTFCLHNLFILTGLIWKRLEEDGYKEFMKNEFGKKGAIYAGNHSSYLDIPAMVILQGKVRFMAKVELSRIPSFGRIIRAIDIPVDRSSKMGSYRAYKQASDYLKAGEVVGVFPEGTTCDNAPKLLPFKNGTFKLAIENNVPIVPVTFLDNFKRYLSDGKGLGSPGRVRIVAHAPIYPDGETESSLKEKVYNTINNRLIQEYGS